MNERMEKGIQRLREMNNRSDIGKRLEGIAPDVSKYINEFAFGDIHCRPGLDKKQRELVIMTCIATLGHGPIELKSHINMALNIGWTRAEVLEVFIQMIVYAGFPTAINAIFVAGEVFKERDAEGIEN